MSEMTAKFYYGCSAHIAILKIAGEVRFNQCGVLEYFLKADPLYKDADLLIVDLSEVELLDSTALGLLAQISLHVCKVHNKKPDLYCPENDVKKFLLAMSLDQLFNFIDQPPMAFTALSELRTQNDNEQTHATRSLSAHKTLMELSLENKKEFQSVVDLLEDSLKGD